MERIVKPNPQLPLKVMFDHLIIDEAQDFSESDLKVMSLISDNITVFADPNQLLNSQGIDDLDIIKSILNIDDDNAYHLEEIIVIQKESLKLQLVLRLMN